MRTIVAVTLALSVFAVLVSPYAASELTTLRTPNNLRQPTMALAEFLFVPLVTWLATPTHGVWEGLARLVLPGSELVSVTCARLC